MTRLGDLRIEAGEVVQEVRRLAVLARKAKIAYAKEQAEALDA